jgi:thioredoxin 1
MSETSQLIFNVGTDAFKEKVIDASHHGPILVDFWADWCSPCIALAPVLDRVLKEYEGRVRLAKVEVDDNMKLAGHYRIRGFPTVVLFIDGEEQDRFAGAKPMQFVREFIDGHLA